LEYPLIIHEQINPPKQPERNCKFSY